MNLFDTIVKLCSKYDVTISFDNWPKRCNNFIEITIKKNWDCKIIKKVIYIDETKKNYKLNDITDYIINILYYMCEDLERSNF